MFDGAKKVVGDKFVGQLSHYLSHNPERNIVKVTNMLYKLAITDEHKRQINDVQRLLVTLIPTGASCISAP